MDQKVQEKNNELFNVFIYETKNEVFSKLFNEKVEFHKARLNGYYAATENLGFKLLKKDQFKNVDGYIYKITKEELFKLDRFLMFPLYTKMQANVINLDSNEIIENTLVYSRLELSEPHEYTDKDTNNDELILKSIAAFNKFESLVVNEPLYDFIFLWKVNKKQYDDVNENPFPFFFLKTRMKEQQDAEINDFGTLFAIKNKNDYYVTFTIFAKHSFLTAIDYYNILYEVPNAFPASYEFYFMYEKYFEDQSKYFTFLNELKPEYFISEKLVQNQKEVTVGTYKRAYEFAISNFIDDHFERYNWLLSAFFDAQENSLKNKDDK